MSDRYQSIIWSGICEEAQARNVNLICFRCAHLNFPGEEKHPGTIFYRIVNHSSLDGIILLTSAIGTYCSAAQLSDFFARYREIPLVSAGYHMPGYTSITVDNKAGMAQLITHLIEEHNHRHFLYISGPQKHWESRARYQAYRAVLKQHLIDYHSQLYFEGDYLQTSGSRAILHFPREKLQTLDVIVASNDSMAFGAIEELQKMGLVVPDELAVVGFDNTADSQFNMPLLTTVAQPLFQMGRDAVDKILSVIRDNRYLAFEQLPSELKIRESCGCTNRFLKKPPQFKAGPAVSFNLDNCLVETVIRSNEGLQVLFETPTLLEFLYTAISKLRISVSRNDEKYFFHHWQVGVQRSHFPRKELHLLNGFLEGLLFYFNTRYPAGSTLMFIHSLLYQGREYLLRLESSLKAREYLDYERMSLTLNNISTQLMSTFTETGLQQVIAECMQQLQIARFFVCEFEPYEGYPQWSRLSYYFTGNSSQHPREGGIRFATSEFLPASFRSQLRDFIFITETLYLQNHLIGYIIIEKGPPFGEIYATLRLKISTALHSLQLVNRVRDHAQDLEKEVARRTADLVSTNEELLHQILQRKQAEEALIENEKTLRDLIESIPVPLFIMHFADNRIIYRNDPFHAFFDNRTSHQYFTGYSQSPQVIVEVLAALQEKDMVSEVELKLSNSRGIQVWMIATFRRIRFKGEDAVIVGLHDISEIKSLQAKLLEVVETEQRRIGLDLHDDVCQNLAGISVMATALGMELKSINSDLYTKINEIARLISQAVSAISKISRGLFPSDLDSSGLAFALWQIVRQAEKQFNQPCQVQIDERIRLEDKEKQLHLFRIGQELIYNAFKHAEASRVSLKLFQKKAKIHLVVQDNGKGFDLNKQINKGMGLRSIMYRAQLIDATLNFTRQNGGGITAQCILQP